jgi:hypothetical protein
VVLAQRVVEPLDDLLRLFAVVPDAAAGQEGGADDGRQEGGGTASPLV